MLSGQYVYIEASSPRTKDEVAEIYMWYDFAGDTCVSFYYHMYGSDCGTLKVSVDYYRFVGFTKTGDQGNQWHQAIFKVSETGNFDVSTNYGDELLCAKVMIFAGYFVMLADDCEKVFFSF